MYDDKVREFVKDIGIENIGKRLVNSREGKVRLAIEFARVQRSFFMTEACFRPLESLPAACHACCPYQYGQSPGKDRNTVHVSQLPCHSICTQ